MQIPLKEKVRMGFYKSFTYSHQGSRGLGAGGPSEGCWMFLSQDAIFMWLNERSENSVLLFGLDKNC